MKTILSIVLLLTMVGTKTNAENRDLTPFSHGNITQNFTDKIISDATLIADRHIGSFVMRISGSSMVPYFADSAVVVVKPISFDKLRAGMIVVYINNFGEKVAHKLIEKNDCGWIVKGYNNDVRDSTYVNINNFQGAVYAIFHITPNKPSEYSERYMRIETALAAPAK